MIERNGDWLSARVGDEIMMMSPEHGKYIGMNEVGARIWELIETPRDAATLCAELQREFDVSPVDCETEVNIFLAEMEKHGAISRS
ncbi:MAG: PqqD family protein [Candidatus Sphingomonas phytovorans]|nr:PqqD family protein [Sphingomonas sp.]WEJ99717.1 MAG: PqqD family protein [Sphingomonas sp.]